MPTAPEPARVNIASRRPPSATVNASLRRTRRRFSGTDYRPNLKAVLSRPLGLSTNALKSAAIPATYVTLRMRTFLDVTEI